MSVEAKRGSIYKFCDERAVAMPEKLVLVVSSATRSLDKIISMIVLSDTDSNAVDVVPVDVEGYGTMYCRCGLPTYLHRVRLGERVDVVDAQTMDRINRMMHKQLGLDEDAIEGDFYKRLYEELLEKVVDKL